MAIYKGRGVRVEISKTEGSAKTVSAVSQESPAEATSTAHGLTNGTVGYMNDVLGMAQLDGQAARVANQATNTFELETIDSTDYAAYTGGEFVPITAWATISNSTDFQIGGGDGEKLDATTLLDVIKKEENGLLAAETVTINNLADPHLEATTLLRAAALKSQYRVFRVTLPEDGSQIIFRGQPSIPGFNMQRGQIATGSFSITVKGVVCYLP